MSECFPPSLISAETERGRVRSTVRITVAFFATLTVLVVGTFALGRFVLRAPHDAVWVNTLSTIKTRAALAVDRPKILVVGGSGALFGVNAEMIEKSTGIPTVNMATHAAIGAAYHLYSVRQVVKPNDIVLLTFEYHALTPYFDRAPLLLSYIFFFDPLYLLQQPELVWRSAFGWNFWRTIDNTYRSYTRGNDRASWPYAPQSITRHGDIDWSQEQPPSRREQIQATPAYYPAMPMPSVALDALLRFIEYCARNNIVPVMVWPNVHEKPEYRTEAYRRHLAALAEYYKSIGLRVVGQPEDAMLPLEELLDTVAHPTSAGSFRRTRLLLKALEDAHIVPSRNAFVSHRDNSGTPR